VTDTVLSTHARSRDWGDLTWQRFRGGVEVAWLYQNGAHGPAAAYLRYAPGARIPLHWHAGYEHVIVLEGAQSDHNGRHAAGSLVINPPGSSHQVVSEEGCVVLIIWERPVVFGAVLPPQ
jgi:anti-sigma factor ChrR (cupin superfamily)